MMMMMMMMMMTYCASCLPDCFMSFFLCSLPFSTLYFSHSKSTVSFTSPIPTLYLSNPHSLSRSPTPSVSPMQLQSPPSALPIFGSRRLKNFLSPLQVFFPTPKKLSHVNFLPSSAPSIAAAVDVAIAVATAVAAVVAAASSVSGNSIKNVFLRHDFFFITKFFRRLR